MTRPRLVIYHPTQHNVLPFKWILVCISATNFFVVDSLEVRYIRYMAMKRSSWSQWSLLKLLASDSDAGLLFFSWVTTTIASIFTHTSWSSRTDESRPTGKESIWRYEKVTVTTIWVTRLTEQVSQTLTYCLICKTVSRCSLYSYVVSNVRL